MPSLLKCSLTILDSRKQKRALGKKDSNFKTGRQEIPVPFSPLVLVVNFLFASFISLYELHRDSIAGFSQHA